MAGAFTMPPVLTLPVVHPRTSNLAWTMSSPADPIACAMQHYSLFARFRDITPCGVMNRVDRFIASCPSWEDFWELRA